MTQSYRKAMRSGLIQLGLAIVLAVTATQSTLASEHNQSKKAKPEIKLDPELQSDITGTVLITGANRGIGLELARNYAMRGWNVIATARKPDKADELNAIAKANPKVTVEQLDVLDHAMIDALAAKYKDQPIDILLNNAAVLGEPNVENFGEFDYDLMERVYATNSVGPMKMAEAFVNSVDISKQKKIVAITSSQGSISSLRSPSLVFYNMSKAALNMGMKSNSKALKKRGITVALVSPGAVDTDMMNLALDRAGVSFKLLTPQKSAEMVINIIDQYDLAMTGTFISHQGKVIPW
jgi:NAD(P)-dependent dehydrogenase (short-subunit alcohol dehydrogenase family)